MDQTLEIKKTKDNSYVFVFSGRLDAGTVAGCWNKIKKILKKTPQKISVQAQNVKYCDAAGAAMFIRIRRHQASIGHQFDIIDLTDELAGLFGLFDPGDEKPISKSRPLFVRTIENIGKNVINSFNNYFDMIAFTGQMFICLLKTIFNPRLIRWKDTFFIAETAGANAVGIVSVIGLLLGLILAFQSAVSLKQFSAEIFVPELVSISLFRFLGPFMTAIILAGRSGSAFAAELGTMKINEEIDALSTMGLEPVQFLAVSRVIAGAIVTPMLTLFTCFFGLIGAAVVMMYFKLTPITFFLKVTDAANLTDFTGGLIKALVFGILISSVGCYRGLKTGSDARAVGASATSAVVSSIMLVVAAEGVFAVLYYFLGI